MTAIARLRAGDERIQQHEYTQSDIHNPQTVLMAGLTMALRGKLFSESSLQQPAYALRASARQAPRPHSECEAEPELRHSSLIGEIAVVGRLAVAGARLRQCVRPIVGAVEEIEHVDDSGDRASPECHGLLRAQIDAMSLLADEVVALEERPVPRHPPRGVALEHAHAD